MHASPHMEIHVHRRFQAPWERLEETTHASQCHVKMGTPQNGDPGSPYSRENGDPGPYIPGKMGTRVPIFPEVWKPWVPIFPGVSGHPWENGEPLYGRPFSGNLGIPRAFC